MRNQMKLKREHILRRARRTRSKITGTSTRPRLSVFRSLKNIYAQAIDDVSGKTLFAASDVKLDRTKKPLERATLVGADMAQKAKAAKVTTVIFDRGAYRYHGRVKALAEAARAGGLEF